MHRIKLLKGSKRSSNIRPLWLLAAIVLIVLEILLVILRNHDAILVIGLHLNFKMGFISDIESQCEQKGTPALILRNENLPKLAFQDDCDRSDLGLQPVQVPDPHASYKEMEIKNPYDKNNQSLITLGGEYSGPSECTPNPKNKLGIIIPHRHREYHLKQLLSVLHPTLQRQKLQYQIFVIHQKGEDTFNKARLLNAGVREALKIDPTINCFIMHDVDLVIEDERNLYYCNDKIARHISAGIDKYNYELPYDGLFGGIVALTREQFERINGYSNEYWGWGCEDDDMFIRVVHSCVGLEHVLNKFAHYKMIYHPHDKENSMNSNRFSKLIHAKERQYIDGYHQAAKFYKVVEVTPTDYSYTNITINVGTLENEDDGNTEGDIIPGIEEDYEVDIEVLILVFILIIYTIYKSRIITLICKRKRQRQTSSSHYTTDYSSSDSTSSDDERPLVKRQKRFDKLRGPKRTHLSSTSGKSHTRSLSVPTNEMRLPSR